MKITLSYSSSTKVDARRLRPQRRISIPRASGCHRNEEPMSDLELIEQKYDFVLPDDYRAMQAAGWFDVVASDDPHYRWRPGPNWLELPMIEWMPLSEILSYEPEDYHKPDFMPFAVTGGGDHWCWWPAEHPNVVVSCPHDCDEGEFYAPSFTGFIYRQLLEFAMQIGLNPTDDGFDPECDPVQDQVLRDAAIRLAPYLPEGWRATLEEIAANPPVRIMHNDKDIGSALLTGESYQAIVQCDLAFPQLDQRFLWMDSDA
jgi:hypothetical protein